MMATLGIQFCKLTGKKSGAITKHLENYRKLTHNPSKNAQRSGFVYKKTLGLLRPIARIFTGLYEKRQFMRRLCNLTIEKSMERIKHVKSFKPGEIPVAGDQLRYAMFET